MFLTPNDLARIERERIEENWRRQRLLLPLEQRLEIERREQRCFYEQKVRNLEYELDTYRYLKYVDLNLGPKYEKSVLEHQVKIEKLEQILEQLKEQQLDIENQVATEEQVGKEGQLIETEFQKELKDEIEKQEEK